jgi:hypothetical protein
VTSNARRPYAVPLPDRVNLLAGHRGREDGWVDRRIGPQVLGQRGRVGLLGVECPGLAELEQLREVTFRDIHEARTMIEPMAARQIAASKDARQVLETCMSATRLPGPVSGISLSSRAPPGRSIRPWSREPGTRR